ncbi:multidrug efflux pump subunit AcrB [Bradyrhizobium barranii subsp. barranii]
MLAMSCSDWKLPDTRIVRKTIGDMRHTLPAGVIGPGFNDEFGDTFGIIYGFTSDGFTQRELRDRVEDIRSRLLLVPDVSKIELLGEQDEVIFVEFSTKELAALGIDRSAMLSASSRASTASFRSTDTRAIIGSHGPSAKAACRCGWPHAE